MSEISHVGGCDSGRSQIYHVKVKGYEDLAFIKTAKVTDFAIASMHWTKLKSQFQNSPHSKSKVTAFILNAFNEISESSEILRTFFHVDFITIKLYLKKKLAYLESLF